MENASKALLIAGEVLIAMLVASVMALLFSTMSSYADENAQKLKLQEIQAFNASVTQYARSASTAQDIVSLVNFAKEINGQVGCTNDSSCTDHTKHINIQVKNKSNNMELYDEDDLKIFLQTNYQDTTGLSYTGLKYYKAEIREYFDDGRIRVVYFEE